MSGHSGFQPIGNNLPPIIPQPQVGSVQGSDQAPQSQPPALSGGDDPARDYNVRKEAAEAPQAPRGEQPDEDGIPRIDV